MIAISGARVLAGPRALKDTWVLIDGERIASLTAAPPRAAQRIELGDVDIIPGLVDLHSDCLELKARPRVSMELPLVDAMLDLDAEVALWGITTHFVCVCLEDDIGKYRSLTRGVETVDVVESLVPELRVEHRIHLRVDVTGEGIPLAGELARRPVVGLLSYMLHLPGIGQFPDEESWRRYYTTVEGDPDGAQKRLALRRTRLHAVEGGQRRMASIAREHRAPLASHDDDTVESVDLARDLGVRISEFPVNASAAARAAELGIAIVMGAPNARAGRSHHGNLSAREALAGGYLTALASDYHPPSLLAAAYSLAGEGVVSWPQAIALVSSGPAHAAGFDDRGVIEAGKRADIVAVRQRSGRPSVVATWVAGRRVI